jgi:Xaa-Pro aminopeptidase
MDRTNSRRERLARNFKADQIDALLISSATNVRYLTGFTGEDASLLLLKKRVILISDGRFTTQIAQECPALEVHVRAVGQPMMEAIAQVVGGLRINALGFESSTLTVAEHLALRDKLPTTELRGLSGRVEALRAVKDREEVVAIREAIDYAERAFNLVRAGLRGRETEKEVADAIEAGLRRFGATAASFPPIVAVGVRAALPHARPTAESRLGDSDFVLIDWGATGRPYKSDLTRVLVTGKVTSKFEKIYRTVLAAQERGLAAIRPGAVARDVDAEARSVIEEAGFGRFFGHGLGHGLGMDIHEAPRLGRGVEAVLEPGMVVTVEPGIYLPDWGGIRIEDDVLVTPDGCEILTRLPKALEVVRVD